MASFGESPCARVASAIITNRSKVNGLYVSEVQSKMLPDTLKQEICITPSSSAPAFGGVCILDFREKNVILHNAAIALNVGAVTGTTGGTNPNLNPATFFIDRLEILQNNVILQVITGLEQFLLAQTIIDADENRSARNYGVGHYISAANRNAFYTNTSANYYINLKSVLDVVRMAILTDQHNIQFKCYFSSLTSVYNANSATGTPACIMNSCSLVTNVTRLDQNTVNYKISEIQKMGALQTMFHETKPATFVIQSGVTTASMVLSSITGNIAYVMFVVRPTASITGAGMWSFLQLKSWEIVNSGGQNIVGSIQIPALMSASVLNPRWSRSTYCTETTMGGTDNGANYYSFSFSADNISALKDGIDGGSYKFTGSESLRLTFNSALGATHQVDFFAYSECVHEMTMSGVRKIAVN